MITSIPLGPPVSGGPPPSQPIPVQYFCPYSLCQSAGKVIDSDATNAHYVCDFGHEYIIPVGELVGFLSTYWPPTTVYPNPPPPPQPPAGPPGGPLGPPVAGPPGGGPPPGHGPPGP